MIEDCVKDIRIWMSQNKLKMNDSKIVFMVIDCEPQVDKLALDTVTVGDLHSIHSSSQRGWLMEIP